MKTKSAILWTLIQSDLQPVLLFIWLAKQQSRECRLNLMNRCWQALKSISVLRYLSQLYKRFTVSVGEKSI